MTLFSVDHEPGEYQFEDTKNKHPIRYVLSFRLDRSLV